MVVEIIPEVPDVKAGMSAAVRKTNISFLIPLIQAEEVDFRDFLPVAPRLLRADEVNDVDFVIDLISVIAWVL